MPIKFVNVEYPERPHYIGKNICLLVDDYWDDFGFKTMFHLWYLDKEGHRKAIGAVNTVTLLKQRNPRCSRISPDILLATPESLEALLISRRTDHFFFFGSVRAIIVDEIHVFAGAHMLSRQILVQDAGC